MEINFSPGTSQPKEKNPFYTFLNGFVKHFIVLSANHHRLTKNYIIIAIRRSQKSRFYKRNKRKKERTQNTLSFSIHKFFFINVVLDALEIVLRPSGTTLILTMSELQLYKL